MHEQWLRVRCSQLGCKGGREKRRQGSSGRVASRAARLAREQPREPAKRPRCQHGVVVACGLHEYIRNVGAIAIILLVVSECSMHLSL